MPAEKILVSPNGVDMTLFGEPVPRDEALARELGLGDEVIGFAAEIAQQIREARAQGALPAAERAAH